MCFSKERKTKMKKSTGPELYDIKTIAKSRLFEIEQVGLTFSNGEKRVYERMKPANHHAVMVAAITDTDDLLLIREYCVGTDSYELGFPKGLIDEGESLLEAANRELKEEIGYGANKFEFLKELVLAPSYFSSKMTLLLATDLYIEKAKGDEPEPLELIRWPLHQADELLTHLDFREARSISALLLVMKKLSAI